MKIGILTDIHEHVEFLRAALAQFQAEKIDQVVIIGDVFETGERIEETCQLLREAHAIGVWGNHDFGLCVDVTEETRRTYSEQVLGFMGSLKPRLRYSGCHFCHIEPWLDPENLEDLWYFDGPPNHPPNIERIFGDTDDAIMFAGHYHQWIAASPSGLISWSGEAPIQLIDDRYFVVVGALFMGQYAILDTDTAELCPRQISNRK